MHTRSLVAVVLVVAVVALAAVVRADGPPGGGGGGDRQGGRQQGPPPMSPQQKAALKAACGDQLSQTCGQPGGRQFMQCLRDSLAKFTDACAAAVQGVLPPTQEQIDAAKAKFQEGCGQDVSSLCAAQQQQQDQQPPQDDSESGRGAPPRDNNGAMDPRAIMQCLHESRAQVSEQCKTTLVYLIQHRPGANATLTASVTTANVLDAAAGNAQDGNDDPMWFAQPNQDDPQGRQPRGPPMLFVIIGVAAGALVLIVALVVGIRVYRRRRAAAAAPTASSGAGEGIPLGEIVVAGGASINAHRQVIPAGNKVKFDRLNSSDSLDSQSVQH